MRLMEYIERHIVMYVATNNRVQFFEGILCHFIQNIDFSTH